MADYDVKVIVAGPDGLWAGTTDLTAIDLPEAVLVLFELGGLAADVVATAADDGDPVAVAMLEAKADTVAERRAEGVATDG